MRTLRDEVRVRLTLAPTSSLKEDLLRPDSFAPPATSRHIELRETHISWVFVLDRDVFKLKRPVNLGFLDFRTKTQRRLACEAEVRLNARLAPHVYLGVVPIRRGDDGRARVGGSGHSIDWAVHMVRLPDEQRTDTLLARQELTPGTVDAIAKRMATFHRAARCDSTTTRFGHPEVIARNIEENFAQTRETIPRYLRSEEVDEVVRWQTSFLRDHRARFERRMATGRVRDGHGDLRLEHIYIGADAAITIIDCIEFNERFRFADVCADIAFLSMDLAGHGRVDLSERLLASYAREAYDFDLYEVVDFYESYRAFVRGKIAAMLANDGSAEEGARRLAEEEARKYFLLSLSADRRSLLLPSVIAVGGLIASGKSSLAERVGSEMSAPLVDTDRTRKALLGVEATRPINDSAWSGSYDPEFTERVYAEALRNAAVVLASGRPVVLEASFRSAAVRRAARDLAVAHHVPFRFIECRAPVDVCRARLADRARESSVSDGRLAIFDEFCARWEPVVELSPEEHVIVDTTRPLETSVEQLRASLDTWPKGFVR